MYYGSRGESLGNLYFLRMEAVMKEKFMLWKESLKDEVKMKLEKINGFHDWLV